MNITKLAIIKKMFGGGSGGGTSGGEEWIGDGKTHLWIKIAAEGRMDVPLYFSQTVANGVTIDWGDGSDTETLSGTGYVNTTHTYANIGEYVIALDVAEGCVLGLGKGSTGYCVMGSTEYSGLSYSNMLQKVEFGRCVKSIYSNAFRCCSSLASVMISDSVTYIGTFAFLDCCSLASIEIPDSVTGMDNTVFQNCYSLASIVIPDGVTSIGNYVFRDCRSLASIVIPDGVRSIGGSAFYGCYSLASIVIPDSVTSIGSQAFRNCYGIKYYDFTKHAVVPTLSSIDAFNNIVSDCEIRVPAALYDEWIAATNWSTYASKIVAA